MQESTGITPKALENRPELVQELYWAYSIFAELSGCRSYSEFGPLPLSFRDYLAYAELYQFTRSETQSGWEDLRLIDNAWLTLAQEQQAAKMKST